MKKIAVLVSVLAACSFAACNYDTGECYLRDEVADGAGGGIITQPGAGGFGDVPPEPQNASDFGDPCSSRTAECTVTWAADSDVCEGRGPGNCTTLFQCQHATLADAKAHCEKAYGVGAGSGALSCDPCVWAASTAADCKERCKKQCDKIHDRCHEDCNKYDPTMRCHAECNEEYSKCLLECEKDCK